MELDAIEPRRWPAADQAGDQGALHLQHSGQGMDRATTATSCAERFEDAKAIVPVSEVMVQDMIPGNGSTQFSYCTFFKGGRSVARMTVQRERQRPRISVGRAPSSRRSSRPSSPTPSERFLQEIDYYGLAELEYKLDEVDGQYKLLDVNTRTWGYHSLGHVAGVDFPLLVQLDQLGDRLRGSAGTPWRQLGSPHHRPARGRLDLVRGGCRSVTTSVPCATPEARPPSPVTTSSRHWPNSSFCRTSCGRDCRSGGGDDAVRSRLSEQGLTGSPPPPI